jgi:hypothetical protein
MVGAVERIGYALSATDAADVWRGMKRTRTLTRGLRLATRGISLEGQDGRNARLISSPSAWLSVLLLLAAR